MSKICSTLRHFNPLTSETGSHQVDLRLPRL